MGNFYDIPNSWHRSGLDFAAVLDGNFAIALFDERRASFVLARDRIGIAPLFWGVTETGSLAFASFPEQLISAGVTDGKFCLDALRAAAAGAPGDREKTLIRGVKRVLPGSVLRFDQHGVQTHRYWRLQVDCPLSLSFSEAAHELRVYLQGAVERALPASGPVATHLSGGLDSGGIAALAAHALTGSGRDVTGYCFDVPKSRHLPGVIQEAAIATAVAKKARLKLETLDGDFWHGMLEGPLSQTFLLPVGDDYPWDQLLAKVKYSDRVLCGYGGDDLVSYNGTGALFEALVHGRVRRLWDLRGQTPFPLWRGLAREVASATLPAAVEQFLRLIFSLSVDHKSPSKFVIGPAPTFPHMPGSTAERMRARIESPTLIERLEEQAWYAARHGLFYAFPLLDWRLLELAIRLPAHLQLRNGHRRALYRAALHDLLPSELLDLAPKLNPDPTGALYVASRRSELIAEAQRLKASRAAIQIADLDQIIAAIEQIRSPEEMSAEIASSTASGRPYQSTELNLVLPFMVARAAAQNAAKP
jgi:asparagine synthase (glutamine-hydrolysing)